MDKEVERLKKEILILNARVKVLEGKEHHRSIFKLVKFLIGIALFALIAFGIWKAYDYITNYVPTYLEEQIKAINPFGDTFNSLNDTLTGL